MTSRVEGSKKKDRYEPVTNKMMNEYSVISPSMNDQWSGKTLLNCRLANLAMPSRSSSQRDVLDSTYASSIFLRPRFQNPGPIGSR